MFPAVKYFNGFTLIETLIGVLLTAIICSALFLGITQAKLYLESIRIKEKAFEELRNWTNEWKSMVAAGVKDDYNDGSSEGEKVILKKDSMGNTIIEGRLFKDISKASSSGQYSIFYNIKTYIVWEVNNFFFNSSKLDTLKFNTYQIQFHIQ
mgnify:CR=1 FL=1